MANGGTRRWVCCACALAIAVPLPEPPDSGAGFVCELEDWNLGLGQETSSRSSILVQRRELAHETPAESDALKEDPEERPGASGRPARARHGGDPSEHAAPADASLAGSGVQQEALGASKAAPAGEEPAQQAPPRPAAQAASLDRPGELVAAARERLHQLAGRVVALQHLAVRSASTYASGKSPVLVVIPTCIVLAVVVAFIYIAWTSYAQQTRSPSLLSSFVPSRSRSGSVQYCRWPESVLPAQPELKRGQPPTMAAVHSVSASPRFLPNPPARQPITVPRLDLESRQERRSSFFLPPPSSTTSPQLRTPSQAPQALPGKGADRCSPVLCMELVVPANNECSLLVPRITNRNPGASGSLTIDDSRGVAVFVAKFSLRASGKPDTGRRLELRSAVDDAVFACCRDAEASSGSGLPSLSIFNSSDRLFGVLHPDSGDVRSSYSILAAQGSTVAFRGDLKYGSMTAADDEGRLLGMTETTNQQRRAVRIGPSVDAGLIVLSLLGIDMLDLERFPQSTPPTSNSPRN